MRKTQIIQIMLLGSIIFSVDVFSDNDTEGKEGFLVCNACHNPSLNPPLAPPMWAVQRRYKKMAQYDQTHFIEMIAQFAKSPTLEKAIFKDAVKKMGLMPAVSLPEEQLENISKYIWNEEFSPPCAHWKNGEIESIKAGDMEHSKKDQRMLERFCK